MVMVNGNACSYGISICVGRWSMEGNTRQLLTCRQPCQAQLPTIKRLIFLLMLILPTSSFGCYFVCPSLTTTYLGSLGGKHREICRNKVSRDLKSIHEAPSQHTTCFIFSWLIRVLIGGHAESIITQWCGAGPWICVARSLKWLLARWWQPSNPREKNSVVDADSSLLSSSRRSRTVRDQEVYCLRSTKPHLYVIRIFYDIYFLVSDTQPRPFASQLDMTGLRYRNQLTWTWERPRVRHYKWKSCGSGKDVWYRVVSEFKSTYVWRFAISRTLDEEIRIVFIRLMHI